MNYEVFLVLPAKIGKISRLDNSPQGLRGYNIIFFYPTPAPPLQGRGNVREGSITQYLISITLFCCLPAPQGEGKGWGQESHYSLQGHKHIFHFYLYAFCMSSMSCLKISLRHIVWRFPVIISCFLALVSATFSLRSMVMPSSSKQLAVRKSS